MTLRWSIIIPTYRRPKPLEACLRSLTELDYPRDAYEVIVVNDGGDPPDSVIAGFAGEITLRLITQANSGPGTARNRGAAEARGEFLAFTDDDCTPDPLWLTKLEAKLAVTPNCMAGGYVLNILEGFRNICPAASQSLVSYLYTYYNRDAANARFFTSNNMALSRRAFMHAGGFDRTYHRAAAEDREFCDRWVAAGRRLVYAPDAVVRHAHHLSLYAFMRQHFNYGRGALHFRHARAARNAEPVRVEPREFYTRLLTYPWREHQPYALPIMALLFVTQAVNAFGYFFEKYLGPPLPPAMPPSKPRPDLAEKGLV